MHQNKPDGYLCVSCAWARPAKTKPFEYCENVPHGIPQGCVGAYFPEANPLAPLSYFDKPAHAPAYQAVPVRLTHSAVQSREVPA